jgi:hypothetical protein
MTRVRVSLDPTLARRLVQADTSDAPMSALVDRAVSEYLANGAKDWAAAHDRIAALEEAAGRAAPMLDSLGDVLRRPDLLSLAAMLRSRVPEPERKKP